MNTILRFLSRPVRVATCKAREDEIKTKCGLSYSPAQMLEMANKGISVSSQNLETKFYDGTPNPSWNLEILRQRGVDLADLWTVAQQAKNKIRNGNYQPKTS